MQEILQKGQKIVAIVPAAGVGSRMQADRPKQYLTIGADTILSHTLHKLITHPNIDRIIVAINPADNLFDSLPIAKNSKIETVIGGNTRAESVLAGLQRLQVDDWALVHDAARPCVRHEDISALIDQVLLKQQGGILAVRVSDTIKLASKQNDVIDSSVDRTYLWAAATPQLFKAGELKNSLLKAAQKGITITDEASAIEYCGGHPLLVECHRDNIKITKPEDLAIAAYYLSENNY
ncbi:2-C-methyl-D-erythritol 4-phosphate cytidylyltransferase [Orbaceae bacterium ESL0721]|nr:2-C-methyl-D-erythritol 4-phosphate cytidylyltransferase [Orbaceae bacterium ESL0721]